MNLLDEARNHALSDYRSAPDFSPTPIAPWPPVDQPRVEVETSPTLETQPTQMLETFYQPPPPPPHPEISLELSRGLADLPQEGDDVADTQNNSDSQVHMSQPDSSEDLALDRTSSHTTATSSFENASSAIDAIPLQDLELTSNFYFPDDSWPNYQEGMDMDSFNFELGWTTSAPTSMLVHKSPSDCGV